MLLIILTTIAIFYLSIRLLSKKEEKKEKIVQLEKEKSDSVHFKNMEKFKSLKGGVKKVSEYKHVFAIKDNDYIEKIGKVDVNEETVVILMIEERKASEVKQEVLSYFPILTDKRLFVTDKKGSFRSVVLSFESADFEINNL